MRMEKGGVTLILIYILLVMLVAVFTLGFIAHMRLISLCKGQSALISELELENERLDIKLYGE